MIIGILTLLFLISTVLLHEYAHFKVGMILGINPVEVGLGFGPTIYKKQLSKYKFAVKLFPLGGYVSYGDSMLDEKVFYDTKPWKKLLISLAGPISNVIYAFILFFIYDVYFRIVTKASTCNILGMIWTAMINTYNIGMSTVMNVINHYSSNVNSTQDFINTISGPVEAYNIIQSYASNFGNIVIIFAVLNISLFWFNMIPFPGLDGSNALISIIEIIIGRKINTKLVTMVNIAGFIILFILSLIILFWDIIKIVLDRIL